MTPAPSTRAPSKGRLVHVLDKDTRLVVGTDGWGEIIVRGTPRNLLSPEMVARALELARRPMEVA